MTTSDNAMTDALPTIKNRFTGAVIYTGESGMTTRHMLEKAVINGADLRSADLRCADLSYADLSSANLSSANLSYANLRYADLSFANLSSADLSSANLSYANLRYANLSFANLSFANLSFAKVENGALAGDRPFFTLGPIGSRSDYLQSFITGAGVMIRAGCFFGTLDEFAAAVAKTHKDTDHAKEYEMAILMIEAHAAIWSPK